MSPTSARLSVIEDAVILAMQLLDAMAVKDGWSDRELKEFREARRELELGVQEQKEQET